MKTGALDLGPSSLAQKLFPGDLVFSIVGGFPRDVLLKKKSMDFDLIIKQKYFGAFVSTFKKLRKFGNFEWSHGPSTTMMIDSKNLYVPYPDEKQKPVLGIGPSIS